MKINSINSTTNYENKQLKNNRKADTNFKGIADIPGIIMQGIENGGFATSFIVQDTLGMTVPRTWEGLNRGIEKKDDDKNAGFFTRIKNKFKNFSLKAMNLKEGAEVFLREALSGPILMFTPMLMLLGAKKYIGKSTFTNSSMLQRLGDSLTNVVKNGSHNTTKELKTAFYRDSITNAVKNTTKATDTVAETNFINKITKEVERLDSLSELAGKSKKRNKVVDRQKSKIVQMFNDYHTTNSTNYSMVNKVNYDGQTYSTSSFVEGLRNYADDAIKNKEVSEITEEYTNNLKKSSIAKRVGTNITTILSTIGAVSIVPKLYSLINPVPPGAIENNNAQKEASAVTNNKVTPQNNNGNKVAFKGKWDKLARNLEFNGNNFTPALMTALATGGLLGPRINTAIKRAPEDPVTKQKDYSEIPEILTRDLISTTAVTFGVPMISKALVSSYEHGSGYVLQNHPDKKLSGFKKFLDFINPFSGINPYNLGDLNSIYSKVDTKEKLNTFTSYIDKNDGSLAKIFKTMDNGSTVFAEHGLDIKALAKQTDRKQANKTIIDAMNGSEEFANKLIDLLKPEAKGEANKIVKRARTLNSITTFAATVALVPAFLGIVLPRIVYAQTEKRQKAKALATSNAQQMVNHNQNQNNQNQQVAMTSNKINYSVLKQNNVETFNKIKHH